jgi:hypothetical protein
LGTAVSAAIICADGGSSDGGRAGIGAAIELFCGATAVAAPATATPARNFRRSTFIREFLRATLTSPSIEPPVDVDRCYSRGRRGARTCNVYAVDAPIGDNPWHILKP